MSDNPQPPKPEPGDFYLDEDGLMVFTRAYHLKRGFCCKSGCKHCPWGFSKPERREKADG